MGQPNIGCEQAPTERRLAPAAPGRGRRDTSPQDGGTQRRLDGHLSDSTRPPHVRGGAVSDAAPPLEQRPARRDLTVVAVSNARAGEAKTTAVINVNEVLAQDPEACILWVMAVHRTPRSLGPDPLILLDRVKIDLAYRGSGATGAATPHRNSTQVPRPSGLRWCRPAPAFGSFSPHVLFPTMNGRKA